VHAVPVKLDQAMHDTAAGWENDAVGRAAWMKARTHLVLDALQQLWPAVRVAVVQPLHRGQLQHHQPKGKHIHLDKGADMRP
jgi:hypothetical protein